MILSLYKIYMYMYKKRGINFLFFTHRSRDNFKCTEEDLESLNKFPRNKLRLEK